MRCGLDLECPPKPPSSERGFWEAIRAQGAVLTGAWILGCVHGWCPGWQRRVPGLSSAVPLRQATAASEPRAETSKSPEPGEPSLAPEAGLGRGREHP